MTEMKDFKYQNVVMIRSIESQSSFLHAFLNGFSLVYRGVKGNCQKLEALVKSVRKDLSIEIEKRCEFSQDVRWYDFTMNGTLPRLGAEYSLEKTKAKLNSETALDPDFYEFVCDIFGYDLYVVNSETKTITLSRLRHRPGIVLLQTKDKFDLLGIKRESGNVDTVFGEDDDFIDSLRQSPVPPSLNREMMKQ